MSKVPPGTSPGQPVGLRSLAAPKPQPAPGKGPWLIWSLYHGAWHRRAADGAAAGYTSDLAQAGIFGREKADQYHERPWRYRRDKAIPMSKMLAEMKRQLDAMTAARDAFAARIEEVEMAARERSEHSSPQGAARVPGGNTTPSGSTK